MTVLPQGRKLIFRADKKKPLCQGQRGKKQRKEEGMRLEDLAATYSPVP